MSMVKLTITVDDEHLASTQSIASELSERGLMVERVSRRAGAIFGSAENTALDAIRSMEGVQDVRSAYEYRLPQFDPAIPQ
ncbi:hypothetical protein [Fulvimarina sp. MAC8]|uniref:hypothetical protein n=1 Tax=Fulvimarina sp. MAC8 TaxID=3162874 RepID=UPI0032ECD50B